MNKTLVVFLLLLLSGVYGYSQTEVNRADNQADTDSIAIFTFKPRSDMFFVPYQNNEAELNRLLKITKQYDAEIKGGQLPVYVNGYCFRSMNKDQNIAMARTWSNRVKSELILRRKLKEDHFITRNYSEAYYDLNYAVVVMLKFPREILKEEIPEEKPVVKQEPKKPEPVVIKEVIEDKETGESTEIEVTIPAQEKEKKSKKAEKVSYYTPSGKDDPAMFSFHTNLLYWAAATPNLGFEWRPDEKMRWGILLNGAWTHWQWKDKTRKYRMWMISPEVRYYVTERWFVGGEFHAGELNIKLSDTGRQGNYYGGGIVGGYRLPVSSRFEFDFTLGLGYTRFDKDNYEMIDGMHVATQKDANRNLWGPTQAGVILRYKLK